MKAFLEHTAKRFGYDGWALKHKDAAKPLAWSVCTTRQEARDLLVEQKSGKLFQEFEVVKVKIHVEAVL